MGLETETNVRPEIPVQTTMLKTPGPQMARTQMGLETRQGTLETTVITGNEQKRRLIVKGLTSVLDLKDLAAAPSFSYMCDI